MANAYVGSLKEIALMRETTRGTKQALAGTPWLAHEGYDFGPKIEKSEATSGIGRIEARNQGDITKEWSEGSLPLLLSKLNAERVMQMVFGSAGVAQVWSGIENSNAHTSFTVYVKDPVAGSKSYKLSMANSITLGIQPDEYIQAGIDLVGSKEASESALTPAYPTNDEILKPKQVSIKIADNYAGLDAAVAVGTVQAFNLNVEKNVEPKWVVGSTEPEDIMNQRMGITGDLTLKYDVDTYRTLGLSDTTRAMRLEVISGTWGLVLDFPSVDFEDWSVESDLDGYMANTLGFKTNFKDLTNGQLKGKIDDTYVSA